LSDVINEYNRDPVEEVSKSISIPALDKIFISHSIPEMINSDNRLPYQSGDFKI